MFKRKCKEIVGKRQVYRRVAQELKENVKYLEIQNTPVLDSQTSSQCSSGISELDKDFDNCEYLEECIPHSNTSVDTSDSDNCIELHQNVNQDFIPTSNLNDAADNLPSHLCQWALANKVPHKAVSELLHILSPHFANLPTDSRTLLKTPKTRPNYKQLENGEYVHVGLADNIKSFLLNNPKFASTTIRISFNIDGLPVFSNSSINFWPILGLIKSSQGPRDKCFLIGVFCGRSKPSPLSLYLEDFINELNELLNEGFVFKGKMYSIEVHSFVCDAPAKAFVKCIKSHSGYSSCDKCTIVGEYVNNKVVFNSTSCPKRTNQAFLEQSDADHHVGITPLCKLHINLVEKFPVDYMHCVCLGVVKKLLTT